jgi:hypothetical protein
VTLLLSDILRSTFGRGGNLGMPTTITDLKNSPSHTAEARRSELIDVRLIDPETGMPWPYYMDAMTVERYLNGLGIKVSRQTLAHKRANGIGIHWRFHGQRPVATREEIERYIREELLRDTSPLAGKTRLRGRAPGRKRKPAANHPGAPVD